MANPLTIEIFRVEHGGGFSMPRITLANRRAGGAHRMLTWVCQRHLEILLYGRTDGGSSGAIWKVLNASGLDRTSLCCTRSEHGMFHHFSNMYVVSYMLSTC